MASPDAAAKLKLRLLFEPYAIHWAADKAQQSALAEAAATSRLSPSREFELTTELWIGSGESSMRG